MSELRTAQLRFTAEEATAFLTEVMELPLSAGDGAVLEARTEGWIAGLQFAALAMQDREDYADFIAAFTGSNRFIVDYLADEVLSRQSTHIQTFADFHSGPHVRVALRRRAGSGGGENDSAPNPLPLTPDPQAYSQLLLEQHLES